MRDALKRVRELNRQLAGAKRISAEIRREGERLTKEVESPLPAAIPETRARKSASPRRKA
jgi:hypothetical protein